MKLGVLNRFRIRLLPEGTLRLTVWYTPNSAYSDEARATSYWPSWTAALEFLTDKFTGLGV